MDIINLPSSNVTVKHLEMLCKTNSMTTGALHVQIQLKVVESCAFKTVGAKTGINSVSEEPTRTNTKYCILPGTSTSAFLLYLI